MSNTNIRAAIIGAGAAGLAVARHLAPPSGCNSYQLGKNIKIIPTVFEMGDSVGGTWIYNELTENDSRGVKIHSSMYKSLRTNLPKEVMAFPDFPFPQNDECRSFITHAEVLQYLRHYSLHFDLEKFIRYKTIVESIEPITEDDGRQTWRVTSRRVDASNSKSEIYDAVVVCNGHYSNPYIPEIEGMASFKGELDHSHNYRENSRFKGKTVAFLGAHASGIDIAIETSEIADQVYLCTRYPEKIKTNFPSNVMFCPAIESMSESSIRLTDGKTLVVDVVIFCTGYNMDFPFLSPDVKLNVDPFRVTPLYKHVISIHHPTLAFLGLCALVCPFPQFDQQAAFIRRILDGSFVHPSVDEMLRDERDDLNYRVKTLGWPERHAHRMNNLQWAYNDNLAELGNFPPLPKVYKDLYEHVWVRRTFDVLGYRSDNYRIVDANTFSVI